MATQTWYLVNGLDSGNWQSLSTSTQSAVDSAAGWVVGTGSTNHSELQANAERASSTFTGTTVPDGSLDTSLKDAFRSPTALTGSFVSANWTLQFAVRSPTQGGAADGRIRFRLIKANADGSSPTEITAGQQQASLVSNVANNADSNSTLTFNPGAFTLNNQYLFVQVAWERTGAGGMTTTNIRLRTGSAATPTGTVITTADFIDAAVGTAAVVVDATGTGASNNESSGTPAITFSATAQSGSVGTAELIFAATGVGDYTVEEAATPGTAEIFTPTSFPDDPFDTRLLLWFRNAGGFLIALDDAAGDESVGTASITIAATAQSNVQVAAAGLASIVLDASAGSNVNVASSGTASITFGVSGVSDSEVDEDTGEGTPDPALHPDDSPERLAFWYRNAAGFLIFLDDAAEDSEAVGTASITIGGSATGQVTEAAAGTAAITIAASATGEATAASAGTASINFAATGLSVGGAVGTASISIGASATGQSTNQSTGAASVNFAASGAASGSASSAGTASISIAGSAQAGSVGISAITVNASGVGVAESRSSGSIAIIISVDGVVQYTAESAGSADIEFGGLATSITSLRLTVTLSNSSFNSVSMSNRLVNAAVLEDSLF